MKALTLALPGDPETRTGGYIYDSQLSRALRHRGIGVTLLRLDDSFPFPDERALKQAGTVFTALPDGSPVLVDGLALGAMPEVVASQHHRLRLIALVHHPLARETGLSPTASTALEQSERDALADVHHVIVTSAWTGALLQADYGVPAQCLTVAEPGTDPGEPARGSGGPGIRFLCVGTLTPRKGHDLLLDALAPLAQRDDWQLLCLGSTDRDPEYAQSLNERVRSHGLQGRVEFKGEVDETSLKRHFREADAFVLATRLEGYGMALAEALSHGLPIITTAGGAAEDTVGPSALLVASEDIHALSGALTRLLDEPHLRRSLSLAALERAAALPTWDDTAAIVESVLLQVCD